MAKSPNEVITIPSGETKGTHLEVQDDGPNQPQDDRRSAVHQIGRIDVDELDLQDERNPVIIVCSSAAVGPNTVQYVARNSSPSCSGGTAGPCWRCSGSAACADSFPSRRAATKTNYQVCLKTTCSTDRPAPVETGELTSFSPDSTSSSANSFVPSRRSPIRSSTRSGGTR